MDASLRRRPDLALNERASWSEGILAGPSNGGKREMILLLLDHGAPIDAIDEEYRSTALGMAARWGRAEMAALLLERGSDAQSAGASWAEPLAWALSSSSSLRSSG